MPSSEATASRQAGRDRTRRPATGSIAPSAAPVPGPCARGRAREVEHSGPSLPHDVAGGSARSEYDHVEVSTTAGSSVASSSTASRLAGCVTQLSRKRCPLPPFGRPGREALAPSAAKVRGHRTADPAGGHVNHCILAHEECCHAMCDARLADNSSVPRARFLLADGCTHTSCTFVG